jgi:hypothetical protein
MKFNAIIFFLIGLAILNFEAIGQRRLPSPPPRPPARVIKSSTVVPSATAKPAATSVNPKADQKKSKVASATIPKKLTEVKEWRQVFKGKIYTNLDSAKLMYQSYAEKKLEIEKSIELDYKNLNLSMVKNSFETTSEFEARKRIAINELKAKNDEKLSPILEALSEFEEVVFLSKSNRFKVIFSDKDYDADAQIWKFKIVDNISDNTNFINIKITPSIAKELWERKQEILVQQVIDLFNPNNLYIWLTYPYQESEDPLIFKYTIRNEDEESELISIVVANDNSESTKDEAPLERKRNDDIEKIYTSVQIPSTFPGGTDAWAKFLARNLNRDLPVENGAPAGKYRVTVSFIVARDGTISDVIADNDPGYGTAEEAVRVIKAGPSWTPAEQNGHKVIYRHRQVLVFQVTED